MLAGLCFQSQPKFVFAPGIGGGGLERGDLFGERAAGDLVFDAGAQADNMTSKLAEPGQEPQAGIAEKFILGGLKVDARGGDPGRVHADFRGEGGDCIPGSLVKGASQPDQFFTGRRLIWNGRAGSNQPGNSMSAS